MWFAEAVGLSALILSVQKPDSVGAGSDMNFYVDIENKVQEMLRMTLSTKNSGWLGEIGRWTAGPPLRRAGIRHDPRIAKEMAKSISRTIDTWTEIAWVVGYGP